VTVTNSLRCMYTNVDCFNNKKDEFISRINKFDPDIIGLTEVNPKSSTWKLTPQELTLDGHALYSNSDGRGSVLYIKDQLQSVELHVTCKSSVCAL